MNRVINTPWPPLLISLIIPALNEADCLPSVLQEAPHPFLYEIIVVDNGSTDATAAVARAAGVRVVSEPRRGYGYACAAGVAAATGELLVFMDGDGSFVPAELKRLVEPIAAGEADLVLGTRLRGGMSTGAMPPHQRWGNHLVAWLLRHFYHVELTDLGPFRAIHRDLLEELEMQEQTYGWPIEMLVKAARRQARLLEVPVSYRPRRAGQSKVGGTLRGTLLATYKILRVTWRYL
jgi:glycosyltransferase involved in cell wall biosynthesis